MTMENWKENNGISQKTDSRSASTYMAYGSNCMKLPRFPQAVL